jgi:3-oxoacyl-[acyl-carrier-protein] synthase II
MKMSVDNGRKRVVITGIGAITPLGLTAGDYWQGLKDGKSGIGPITLWDCSLFDVKIAAEVKGFDPGLYMDPKRVDRTSRCSQFAIATAKMAVESARLDMSREKPEEVGVVLATSGMTHTLINYAEILKTRPGRIDPLMINRIAPSMVPCQVGLEIGARGPNSSLNSACASGSDALGTALHHLRMGQAEVMIAGASETTISEVSIASLARVGALSRQPDPAKASRPFDLNRDGFVYGEGAAIMILETLEHALKRNTPILAELAGAGWSFDAYNDTAPDPDIQAIAMRKAIQDAGISINDVDYVNAHGTSTRLNDTAETKAIKQVFGDRAYKIPISSNKSMIGHLACAAGAVEAAAVVMTIRDGIIPPTINYETPDPECDLDYVPNTARRQKVNACLSNSFGMGGQNCCIIITSYR